MSGSYTGLHGRGPYEPNRRHAHYVPEGWEDLNRGICPGCGRLVRWQDPKWVLDPTSRVLVISADLAATIVDRIARCGTAGGLAGTDQADRLRLMLDVQEPLKGEPS